MNWTKDLSQKQFTTPWARIDNRAEKLLLNQKQYLDSIIEE